MDWIRTAKAQECDGCGRLLPKGSRMLRWNVWEDGYKIRLRFCEDCERVIYGCGSRRSLDFADDMMVREVCETCDDFPVCDRVEYLRESERGKIFFGGLDGIRSEVQQRDMHLRHGGGERRDDE